MPIHTVGKGATGFSNVESITFSTLLVDILRNKNVNEQQNYKPIQQKLDSNVTEKQIKHLDETFTHLIVAPLK